MSNNSKSTNVTLIIVAIIGLLGTVGAALITKGYFDKKIEKEYTPVEEINKDYTSNIEVEKLKQKIESLEQELKTLKSNRPESQPTLPGKEDDLDKIALKSGNKTNSSSIQKFGDWRFQLVGCKKSGNGLKCNFIVESKYRNRYFTITGGKSRIYDDFGNEYKGKNTKLSNSQVRQEVKKRLIANVPTKGSVTFPNISTRATKITLLEFAVNGGGLTEKTIQFRDIRIE